ncbi:MAG TPA: SpoIIE family protein phosphatase [Treponemataceae bacterium]|nr:SpoIIE family protein phosphatase [Treponemataceae bacterium]HQL31652.1 SpoIIE family protein phosphatase [Treponemataceae bacterium]
MSDAQTQSSFIEVAHYQLYKSGQGAGGDTFLSQKNDSDGRVITVLSDGLGSGIKAGVLSTLTATMAMKFVAADMPIQRAAEIIMSTLPVCKERGISYATFTLVDIEPNSTVKIMEYDNPGYVLVRQDTVIEPIKNCASIERKNRKTAPQREAVVYYSDYRSRPGDRLVFFSDGVTQSGMGTKPYPLGWGAVRAQEFILEAVRESPEISARELAKRIVLKAQQLDCYRAKDDITCGVIYFRRPRDLLIMTGPPINPDHDTEMVRVFSSFSGKKIVSGGTTANILSRELGRKVTLNLRNIDPNIPPVSQMDGADLVTEGIITLGRVAEILEQGSRIGATASTERDRENGAGKIVEFLLDSDRITFVVGTRINDAHQDPNMPVELEIRRNIVKRIQMLLAEHYLKEVTIRYL